MPTEGPRREIDPRIREEAFEFVVKYGLARQFSLYARTNIDIRMTREQSEMLNELAEESSFNPETNPRHSTLWRNLKREVEDD